MSYLDFPTDLPKGNDWKGSRLTTFKWYYYWKYNHCHYAKVIRKGGIILRIEFNKFYHTKRLVIIDAKTQRELINKVFIKNQT